MNRLVGLFLALTAMRLLLPAPSDGCAPVMGKGQRVDVASETALIVWDAKEKKQHFIRRASFQTEAP
jgi:hypothetical protein